MDDDTADGLVDAAFRLARRRSSTSSAEGLKRRCVELHRQVSRLVVAHAGDPVGGVRFTRA